MNLKAIRSHLLTNLKIRAALSQYDFGSGNVPAVFLKSEPPPDAKATFITIEPSGGVRRNSRGIGIAKQDIIIGCHMNRQGSHQDGRVLADRCGETLNDAVIHGVDGEKYSVTAGLPSEGLDSGGFPLFEIPATITQYGGTYHGDRCGI